MWHFIGFRYLLLAKNEGNFENFPRLMALIKHRCVKASRANDSLANVVPVEISKSKRSC